MADAPRLTYPLRLRRGGALTVEQDSLDDLVSTAYFALRTPPEWRPEAPGFGVADQTFELVPMPAIVEALMASDSRLSVLAEEERAGLIDRIRLVIGGAEE
jgi:hypothetical protein